MSKDPTAKQRAIDSVIILREMVDTLLPPDVQPAAIHACEDIAAHLGLTSEQLTERAAIFAGKK